MTAGTNAREFILMPEDPIKHRFASMKKKKERTEAGRTNRPPIGFDKLPRKNGAINSLRLRCIMR